MAASCSHHCLIHLEHRDAELLNQQLWDIIPSLQKGMMRFLAAAGKQRFMSPDVVIRGNPTFEALQNTKETD